LFLSSSIADEFHVVRSFSVVVRAGSLLLDFLQHMASLNVLGDIAEAFQPYFTAASVADRIELVKGTCERGVLLGATVRGRDRVPVAVWWLLSTVSPVVFLPASTSISGISGSLALFLFLLVTASLIRVVCMAFLARSMGFVAIIAI
jgi:hypothetical protein